MRYVSTRGEAPVLGFADALLAGLARDGGLYLPETFPTLSADTIAGFSDKPYGEVAGEVLTPFVGDTIEAGVGGTLGFLALIIGFMVWLTSRSS